MKYLVCLCLGMGIAGAYTVVVVDFDDGNITSPVSFSLLLTNATGSLGPGAGGMGDSSLHATGALGNPSGSFSLLATFSPGLFKGQGLFFYARGKGVWDVGVGVLGAASPAIYRMELGDTWQACYIRWEDFFYSYAETQRPDFDTSLLVSLYFTSQQRQGGTQLELWLDSLGYFYSEGPQAWDYDGDGVPDSCDPDADGDGWPWALEDAAGTDPLDSLDYPEVSLGVPQGCYFGLFPVAGLTDEWMGFEDLQGISPALVTIYTDQWGDSTHFYHFDRAGCDFIARQGAVPVYQWPMIIRDSLRVPPEWRWWDTETYPLETRFSPESVIAGVYDGDIARFAREVADWGLPIFINPLVEYNTGLVQYSGLTNFGPDASQVPPKDSMGFLGTLFGDTLLALCGAVPPESMCTYYGDPTLPDGPERVADAFARLQDVFAAQGAGNVIWTLQAHPRMVPDTVWGAWNTPSHYYPPDHLPGWHASSGHHGFKGDTSDPLWELTEVFGQAYDTLLAIAPLPVLIIEFATHSYPNGDSSVAGVLSRDFCDYLKNLYPQVKGITYVNSDLYGTDYLSVGLQLDSARAQAFPAETAALGGCVRDDPYYLQRPLLSGQALAEGPGPTPGELLGVRPNPFVGAARISLPPGTGEVAIYDPAGRLLWQRKGPGPLLDWPGALKRPGVYMVVARTERGLLRARALRVR